LIGATSNRKLTPLIKGLAQVSGGDHLHNPHKTPDPPGDFFSSFVGVLPCGVGRWRNQTVILPAPHFNC
jgi:hypothetical protein